MAFYEKNLSLIINRYGIDKTNKLLSKFSCKENKEVESFLKEKAINHEQKGLSKTIIIFDSKRYENIVGYYSISIKSLQINSSLSTSKKKKTFGTSQTDGDIIPSILIGQLGINDNIKTDLNGKLLMKLIFKYIKRINELVPSMICYVEHNGSPKLRHYYEKNGFHYFERPKEKDGLYCHMILTKTIIESI